MCLESQYGYGFGQNATEVITKSGCMGARVERSVKGENYHGPCCYKHDEIGLRCDSHDRQIYVQRFSMVESGSAVLVE